MLVRYTVLTLLMILSLGAFAENGSDGFSEGELQTLFTSPSQRRSIDSTRQGITSAADTLQSGPSSVQINGIVSRGDNKSVVWINGQNTMNNTMVGGVKVYPNNMNKKNNRIPVMIDGRRVYVKPGETWSEETGVSDLIE